MDTKNNTYEFQADPFSDHYNYYKSGSFAGEGQLYVGWAGADITPTGR